MKSSDSIELLLTSLKEQTSPAFDTQTLQAMFAALGDASLVETSHSWPALVRAFIQSRLVRLAAAMVLVVTVLLVGRHLMEGQPATTNPPEFSRTVGRDQPGPAPKESGTDVHVAQATIEGLGQSELLEILSSSPLDTQIRIAAWLGERGDSSAIGPLQQLADAWQGESGRNPFLDAIRQIESRLENDASEPNVPFTQMDEARESQQVSLVRQPETGIAGVVIDKLTLEPIEGATVYQRRSDPNTFTQTNVQGRFRLVGLQPSQRAYLYVIAPGYTSQRVIGQIIRNQVPDRLRIQLTRGSALCGYVTDTQGFPVSDAEVSTFYFTNVPAATDANGFYLMDGLDPVVDRYSLHITHPDYPAQSQSFAPEQAGQTGVQNVVMEPGVDIYGQVTDAEGNPVPGVRVGNTRSASMWNCIEAKTDAQGWYRLDNVDRGELTLWAVHQDHPLFVLETSAGTAAEKEINIPLGTPRALRGKVVDQAGRPVPGVQVSVHEFNDVSNLARKRYRTNAEGQFVIANAPAMGRFRLNVFGGGISSRMQEIDLSQVTDEHVISVSRAGRIYGLVLDDTTGDPISDFTVKMTFSSVEKSPGGYASAWNREGYAFTSEQGHFDTGREDLAVGGPYRMTVLAEGFNRLTIDPVYVQAITDDPNRTVFRLPSAEVVSGIVVDEAGNPVPNATVAFYGEADRHEPRYWTRAITDDMGIFLVSGIGDTEDHVQVTADGYARLSALHADFVAGPGQPLHIVLTQGGTLIGFVTDGEGSPRADVKVTAYTIGNKTLRFHEETQTDMNGMYEFEALPVGRLTVNLMSADGQTVARKEVTVEAGQTQEVNFGN